MQFVNRTVFPAVAFAADDIDGNRADVVVLRQTLTWSADGRTRCAPRQQPLCMTDEPHADGAAPLYESDLCPTKSRCDVLVHAIARPPASGSTQYAVRLLVRGAVAVAGDPPLIDKTLVIHGERRFVAVEDRARIRRWWQSKGTQPRARHVWRLSAAAPAVAMPVRLDYAFGGCCRQAGPPPRVDACAANPHGLGFVRDWHLEASGATSVAAARIERPGHAIDIDVFERLRSGRPVDEASLVAGFGIRPKAHPDRARWAGTPDAEFANADRDWPAGFDVAIWNSAWPDQQVDALRGDEIVELTNLCAADAPGAWLDDEGQCRLRIALPGGHLALVVKHASGEVVALPMRLDTLIVEPDRLCVSLVWRARIERVDVAPVRTIECVALDASAAAQFEREVDALRRLLMSGAAPDHPEAA